MTIETLIDAVIGREGENAGHADDRGGPTRWGITHAVARAYGWKGDMCNFPREDAVSLYRAVYWHRPGLERIAALAPGVAAEMFDTGINMGPAIAIRFMKRALNALNRGGTDYADIDTTPLIDAETLDALSRFLARRDATGEKVLIKAIEALQGERFVRLAETRPENEAFVFGWLADRVMAEKAPSAA